MINKSKQNYYSRVASKLTNVQRNSTTYWSLLNRFLNNKKIPLIPPLFHENKFVTDFLKKAELFNALFAKQCSLIKNSSKLLWHLHYLTDNRLSSVSFSQDDIAKIIQNLDPNKAHGHDNISIRMLKICGSSIYKPLEMILKQCIETGFFPSEWKKANIVPIHKKRDKQTLENYRPVSWLPICGKILEGLMFNEMFNFFMKINLFHRISPVLNRVILALISCYLSLMRYMNLLTWDSKSEASSLIYQKHLIRCGMMVSSTN